MVVLRPFALPKRLGCVTGQRLVQRDSPTWYSLTFQKEASVYSLGCTALFDSLRIYQAIDYEKFLFQQSAVLDAKEKREILRVHCLVPGISRSHLLTVTLDGRLLKRESFLKEGLFEV